jgi:D-alanyl-D-alanine carboxypeptidase
VAQLKDTMAQYNVPGAVMAVCEPGFQDWVTAEGVRDLTTKEPMTTDLEWGIRSITKSFTVTMLLQLVDEGKIALDDTIDTWVPGIPNGSTITLRELAAMTSGVPEYTTQAFVDDFVEDPERDFSTEELIDYARAGNPMFQPGAQHVYANTSTLLLGQVVEKVTGQTFDEALKERIIDPLGLTATRYPASAQDWAGPHPTGYQPGDDGTLGPQPDNFTVFGPAGAMTSNATDLCTWARAMGAGELLAADTQRTRLVGTPLDKGPEYDTYGLGIGSIDGWVGHTGEGFGITALTMYNQNAERSVVILMNVSGLGDHVPTKLFRQISGQLTPMPAPAS